MALLPIVQQRYMLVFGVHELSHSLPASSKTDLLGLS